jgi:site-specific recombinase XerD
MDSPRGNPVCIRSVADAIVKSVSRIGGLTGVNWHWLRQAHATLLDSVGAPSGTTQALLGRSSSEITRETYIHSVPADVRCVVNGVEMLI